MPHIAHTIDGKPVPSVTQVIGLYQPDGLVRWRGYIGNEAADKVCREATDFGTRVHDAIERILRGNAPFINTTDPVSLLAGKAVDWLRGHGMRPLEIESHLESKKHMYGGTADFIYEREGRLGVGDWKTSKQHSVTHWLQLAAYAAAWNEAHRKTWKTGISEGYIVRVDKKDLSADIDAKPYGRLKEAFDVFKGLRGLYAFLNNEGIWEEGNVL